jgi:hypothetical protein
MTSNTIGTIEQETTEAVGQNRQALAEELNKIQHDNDLSQSAKARLSAKATQRAEARHAEIVSTHEDTVSDRLEKNEKAVFNLSYPSNMVADSDREGFRNAYRDATFRLLDVSAENLERVMSRALRTGDTALQQAAYHEAIERGAHSVAEEYRERNAKARQTWKTYVDTRRAAESREAILGSALLKTGGPGGAA